MFKVYSSNKITRLFFRLFFFGNMFLGIIALYGFISGAGIAATISGFTHLVIVSMLSLNHRFRNNPLAIAFCFYYFLFFSVPVFFVLLTGGEYEFGYGLGVVPFGQKDYQESFAGALFILNFFWVAVWMALISIKPNTKSINEHRCQIFGVGNILFLGLLVLGISFIGNQEFIDARLNGRAKNESLLLFMFFDHAYLVLASILLYFLVNKGQLNNRRFFLNIKWAHVLIFIFFVIFFFNAGSKGAILVVFILFLLYPLYLSRVYNDSKILFPSFMFVLSSSLIAPVMFYIASLFRNDVALGLQTASVVSYIQFLDLNALLETLKLIAYRLSAGGLDRYLLILQSFPIDSFDFGFSKDFATYLAKSFLNLVLPGSPFPESYLPTSQLFPDIINKIELNGASSKAQLIKSMNTQPFTLFGLMILLFGPFSLLFTHLLTVLFYFIFNKFKNLTIKLFIIYLFSASLASFGFEVALANSLHFVVSMLFMYFFIKLTSISVGFLRRSY
jgi:hypothetical protein